MKEIATQPESRDESLKHLGLDNLGHVYWDLPTSALYEEAIRRYEAALSHLGPLVTRTGQYTGRLPHDKFFVREPSSENKICWGKINRPLAAEKFDVLKHRLCAYLQGKDIFIQNSGALKDAATRPDPIFGIAVALSCPGVPGEILGPRNTWNDQAAYDRKASELAGMFEANFAENASDASAEIKNAGPMLPSKVFAASSDSR